MKIGSDDLKTLGMCWLRYKKQLDTVCTEDPVRSADVIGTDSSMQCRVMIEIETKVSISDLRADLKKTSHSWRTIANKHERLSKALKGEELKHENFNGYENSLGEKIKYGPDKDMIHGVDFDDKDHSVLPTQFYFLVPEEIKDKALEVINELYPHAGLMAARPLASSRAYFGDGALYVVKKAPRLHKRLIAKGVKGQILSRMTSEICKLRLENMVKRWSNEKTTGGSSV